MAEEEDNGVKPTSDELVLFDDISSLARSLWKKSLAISGLNTDPKMFSIALFRRLWSNHRGYTLLWNNYFRLESDIVLRSALEAAICLSAIAELKEEFVLLMKRDAAFTLLGQVKTHRDNDENEMVRDCERTLRLLQNGLPEGVKAAKLDWKKLAAMGKIPHLYDWHRMLSGVSSHVTGLSIIAGFGGEGLEEKQEELRKLNRKMHLMMMAGATLQGSMHHAEMIGDDAELKGALTLIDRLNALSWDWPGVERREPEANLS